MFEAIRLISADWNTLRYWEEFSNWCSLLANQRTSLKHQFENQPETLICWNYCSHWINGDWNFWSRIGRFLFPSVFNKMLRKIYFWNVPKKSEPWSRSTWKWTVLGKVHGLTGWKCTVFDQSGRPQSTESGWSSDLGPSILPDACSQLEMSLSVHLRTFRVVEHFLYG